ncbi:MAG: hypothetical protein KGS60_06985 [Verrucomicrobia bacterium]|nr:hypothetical protein [Verrucomicrobiota bacterium]
MRTALILAMGLSLLWMPSGEAKEKIYRGKWDGTAIEIRLRINERSGAVSGQVYPPGDPANVLASLSGRLLPDGVMELTLTYRFEEFGTFRLQMADDGVSRIWRTERKDLWFGLSD